MKRGEWWETRTVRFGFDPKFERDPSPRKVFCGNFRGWVQFRKTIKNEHDFNLLSKSL